MRAISARPARSTSRRSRVDLRRWRFRWRPQPWRPTGSDVRVLLEVAGAGMAHFELAPGRTSRAVRHRTVEEIWYFVAGRGEMWRRQDGVEELVVLEPGVCLTIPLGTEFQFRSLGGEPLAAIGVTMPPWPGEDEAELVEGYAEWTTDESGDRGRS
jgi:mannose-6-phosphate isomerase-like protein (cupin superfamily)